MEWNRYHIKRILLDLSLLVTNQPFLGVASIYQCNQADWKDDIGLDSIELMQLAAQVNTFFNLFEKKEPPYLLATFKVDDWIEKVYQAIRKEDTNLSFHSSGTSGQTKIVKHSTDFLQREIQYLSSQFQNVAHIIPYVPSYTIYGFLFSVGLPLHRNIPVLYPSETDWQCLPANLLIVATPFHWQLLTASLPENIQDCYGVSAAAPLFKSLYQDILNKNICLKEIYGSTETAGVGYRSNPKEPFTLFPYWTLMNTENGPILKDKESGDEFQLMDTIEQSTNTSFTVSGRKDKQVNIAGKLVNPEEIRTIILQIENIKECLISAKSINNEFVLEVSIVVIRDGESERANIKKQIRELLPAQERPRKIYFESI